MMYNTQLDTFLKVAELGSFNKAADALYITPPPLPNRSTYWKKTWALRCLCAATAA